MERIKIKYHSDKIQKLQYIDGKSDWIDLRAAEEVEFKAGEFVAITGESGSGKSTIARLIPNSIHVDIDKIGHNYHNDYIVKENAAIIYKHLCEITVLIFAVAEK